jgi:hypothetical protein
LRTSSKPKRNTESITFRLDSNVLGRLRSEAAQKDVSINTLVSQVMKQHCDWHSNAAKAGFIAVRKGFLTKIMDKISAEEIRLVSKELAAKETKDFVLLLRSEYNLDSALSVAENLIRISGYPFRHETTDTVHSYVIQHDMGSKMSLHLASLYESLFQDFGLERVQMDISDNVLSFVVDLGSI